MRGAFNLARQLGRTIGRPERLHRSDYCQL